MKRRFSLLLKEVQEIAARKAALLSGSVQKVLVEQVNEQDGALVTGRMENNSVVHLPGTKELIGTIIDVSLEECKGFYYMGKAI